MINLKTMAIDQSASLADKAAGRYLRYVYERERSLKWLDPLFSPNTTIADCAYQGLPKQPYADPQTIFYSLKPKTNSLNIVDLSYFLSPLIDYLHRPTDILFFDDGWYGLLNDGGKVEYLDPIDLMPYTPERLLYRMGITERDFFRGKNRPDTLAEMVDRAAGYYVGSPRYNADALNLLVRLMHAETVIKVDISKAHQRDSKVYGVGTWWHRIDFNGSQSFAEFPDEETYIYSGQYENIRQSEQSQSHYWNQGSELFALRTHWDYTAILNVKEVGDGFHPLGTNLSEGKNRFFVAKSKNLHPIIGGGDPEGVRLLKKPPRTQGLPAPADASRQTRRTSGFRVSELILDFRGSFDFL